MIRFQKKNDKKKSSEEDGGGKPKISGKNVHFFAWTLNCQVFALEKVIYQTTTFILASGILRVRSVVYWNNLYAKNGVIACAAHR